jgi:hypothetical protein
MTDEEQQVAKAKDMLKNGTPVEQQFAANWLKRHEADKVSGADKLPGYESMEELNRDLGLE